MSSVNEPSLGVTVCCSTAARQTASVQLQVPPGSRVHEAVRLSGLLADVCDAQVDAMQTCIWGRKVAVDHLLRDGDRIELVRPLKVDPKVARRERFSRQGARSTGLFAKRRAGAKSGY